MRAGGSLDRRGERLGFTVFTIREEPVPEYPNPHTVALPKPDEGDEMSSTPTLTNCTFSGNSAAGTGGGVGFIGKASLTSCTFTGNVAGGGGGLEGFEASLTDCTLNGNSTGGDGGGIEGNDLSLTNFATTPSLRSSWPRGLKSPSGSRKPMRHLGSCR